MKEKITLRYLVAIFLVLLLVPAYAQVGVGTLTPHSSAKLEVVSDTSGVLLTRMTYTQMTAISNPADGLLVYCTDDAGFFVYQNSQWQKVGIQNLTISGDSLKIDKAGTGVNLAAYKDNTDNQSISRLGLTVTLENGGSFRDSVLSEAQVDAYVNNNGYLTSFTEVDGSTTNEIQNLTLLGDSLKIDKAGTGVNLAAYKDNTDDQSISRLGLTVTLENGGSFRDSVLGEAQVDAYVNNNGYLTSFTEVDGSTTNEIQNLTLSGDSLKIDKAGTGVDLASFVDNAPKIIAATGTGNYHFGLNNMDSIQSDAARNIALGENSLDIITTGDFNIGLGYNTMLSLTSGYGNVAIGTQALKNSTTGHGNIGIGRDVGEALTTGHRNVLIGKEAGKALTTEAFNTFIGNRAGYEAQTSSSVFIGSFAGWGEMTDQMLYIENSGDSIPLIGGSFNKQIVGINMPTPALQSGATLQVGGDISLENGGAIDEFSTDVSLAGNSDLAVPTEKAVKTYVDNVPKVITAIGTGNHHFDLNNMDSIQSGASRNIALGENSLNVLTTGDFNIGVGYNTNLSLTSGYGNVAIGTQALKNGTTGFDNIGIGRDVGEALTTGHSNVLVGKEAGKALTTEALNTFIGNRAGYEAQTSSSVFIGSFAGWGETTDQMLYIENSGDSIPLIGGRFDRKIVGINMPAPELNSGATLQVGGDIALENGSAVNEFSTDATLAGNSHLAVPTEKAVKTYVDNIPRVVQEPGIGNYHLSLNNMRSIQSGAAHNMAFGENSLNALTTGDWNIGLGYNTMSSLTSGSGNIVIGTDALKSGTTVFDNIAIGRDAGESATTGHSNVLVGKEAGESLITEAYNTFIGTRAGYEARTNSSIFIGSFAGWGETNNQMLYIENSGDSIPLIGGSFSNNIVGINMAATDLLSGATFQVGGDASKSVAGNWSANSDKRLKTNINYMQSEEMLQKMLALKGVTYEWNDTVTGIPRPEGIQYGFIAQDLEKVWPSKISKDGQGYLLTSYGDYDPMFVESIKALYQRITELEIEKKQLQHALSRSEKEQADIRSETKSETEELRNEIDNIKKLLILRGLSVQQIQAMQAHK